MCFVYFTAIKKNGRRKKKKPVRNETSHGLWFDRRVLIAEDHKLSMRMAVQIKKLFSMCLSSLMSTVIEFWYFTSLNYGSLIETAGAAKQSRRNIELVAENILENWYRPLAPCAILINVLIEWKSIKYPLRSCLRMLYH